MAGVRPNNRPKPPTPTLPLRKRENILRITIVRRVGKVNAMGGVGNVVFSDISSNNRLEFVIGMA
jgi:hypothetical protein